MTVRDSVCKQACECKCEGERESECEHALEGMCSMDEGREVMSVCM